MAETPAGLLSKAADMLAHLRMDTPEDQALTDEMVALLFREASAFDRWLAAHVAQVKAETWDEGAKYGTYRTHRGEAVIYDLDNPHRAAETEATR